MNRFYSLFPIAFLLCLWPLNKVAAADESDTVYVVRSTYEVDLFPRAMIAEMEETDDGLTILTEDGTKFTYKREQYLYCDRPLQLASLSIESFKFNNKFNHQVFSDIDCEIVGDSLIRGQVAAVGHWLTPSFKIEDKQAEVMMDDTVRLVSKRTRVPMYEEHTLTVTDPKVRVLTSRRVRPAKYVSELKPVSRTYRLRLDWPADRVTDSPRIDIHIENDEFVRNKVIYLNATISMDGAGVYPSMDETPVQIRGRGNSSWHNEPFSKNPYRLKFEEKVKPFGLHGGKSWVLLANRQRGSMMTNAIGMYAAGIVGTEGANHIVPVDLYINDYYWGSYNLTEKVGFANNSIDLEDESKACLLELDTYYDEKYKFKTRYYSLPVNIKEPDFSEAGSTEITQKNIENRMNAFARAIYRQEEFEHLVDIESLARYLMVSELIINYELMHPKSTFLYHENVLEDTCKFKWGPIWDLDYGYGYEQSNSYFQEGTDDVFWTEVVGKSNMESPNTIKRMRMCSPALDRAMYKTWTLFMRDHLQELIDYCDDYFAFAQQTLDHNREISFWSDYDYYDYAWVTENAKEWLRQRAIAAYAQLTPYELTDEELGIETPDEGYIPFDGIAQPKDMAASKPTLFDVYDLRGVLLKSKATFQNLRDGLRPGLYIVNGKKMMIK
ncbi:MAG: CotH kinase family protein [Bacteroidaceae bacterium]|nr:CotH kinase family protein [Bacteroidaceae bacterium]